MAKEKRPIARIDNSGRRNEVVAVPNEEIDRDTFMIVCLRLGQVPILAQATWLAWQRDELDAADRSMIKEELKSLRAELRSRAQPAPVEPVENKPKAAPRNGKHLKQRVTVRDPISGQVIRLEDV